MYALKPLAVYALEGVADDPLCARRMERMLAALGVPASGVREITPENLPETVEELLSLWPPDEPPADVPVQWTRPLVFTRQYLDGPFPDISELLQRCPEGSASAVRAILGHIDPVRTYHKREDDWQENRVCWPTYDFGTMAGCPHGCQYCGEGKWGKFTAVGVNIEEHMEKAVVPTIEEQSWQRCFRMIGWGADHIAWEPEYDVFGPYTRTLAAHDRYGYFHTASDNVDWIADLPHKDRLIGVWSLACGAVARDVEPGSPSDLQRIEAMARCQEMGVPVRVKFKPIVPVKNWRDEYAATIKALLERVEPESIGMCVIMWMGLDELGRRIDLEMLDQEFVEAARAAREEMAGSVVAPFPHHVRREVYRFFISEIRRWNKDVRLYISTESREMWDELKDELGQDPLTYRCGCSSVALPGGRLALSRQCPHSTYRLVEG